MIVQFRITISTEESLYHGLTILKIPILLYLALARDQRTFNLSCFRMANINHFFYSIIILFLKKFLQFWGDDLQLLLAQFGNPDIYLPLLLYEVVHILAKVFELVHDSVVGGIALFNQFFQTHV